METHGLEIVLGWVLKNSFY